MKLTNHKGLRASGMIGLLLIELLLMGLGNVAHTQTFSTTTVQGTVYLANGQPGTGTLVVSWPSFTTASGQMVTADSVAVTIAPDGFVSVNLAPNQGASPAGLYYTAIFYMSDGSVNTQYWLVPATASATLGQVQAQLMPSTQAIQAVSKAYVDQAVASVTGSTLTASGGTLSGPLTLCCDPVTPLQAADKRYVDAASALAAPLTGGTLTGPLTATKLGALYQVDQFAGADFGAKLQACLNGLSSTNGGTCDARNFTGTLAMAASLTISKANATVLLPCATISTANRLVVTAGTRNVSLRGCALRGASTASGSQGGTVFYYSGTGAMVQVGDTTYAADTLGFHLDNAVVNITAASSASAQGFAAYRTQELDLENLYFLGNQNQTAMTLDGTGNYTGGTFYDNEFTGFQTAVNAIGHQITNAATTDWVNASTFVRLHIDCPTSAGSPISGTTGINLQQGDGNTFTGGDVEGCSTALHLGANAQNNTIVGLRNENSTNQVVADAGSSYNDWMTGGTMFSGKLTDNGTRNSFLDTFHRSFNGLNGDWYGSQTDATVTNHYRLGTGAGNERGLLNEIQTDYGYRWVEGYTDATAGEQFYQVQDLLNNVNRISVGQYNNGQSNTNNQTVVNSAGTGAVVLNGANNAGTGGVVIGSGGASETTVATISNAGNAQFNGSLQVGGASTLAGTATVKNQADAEIDATLWAGLTAAQNESFIYKNYLGASQWYMENHTTNDWSLTSAAGGLDSFKAYQSTNSGDTYINTSNSAGVLRINYETGSGTQFKVYGGNSSTLYASFTGTTSIQFPGLAASSGHNCLQVDNSGYVTNTGSACGAGSGSGTVNSGTSGQIAYYSGTGTALSGTSTVSITAGGTGASTASGALANLGGAALTGALFTGPVTTPNMIAKGSPWFDVTGYGATGNAHKGIDGVTTANSATFTSASAQFNCSTDVGKVIQIQKGGAAGVPLLTTIAGCASASSITLARAASNAATAQMFFWGTDDSAAFISARNAAAAAGGKVFVPTGIYLVSANPVITTNNDNPLTIEGTCSFEGTRNLALGGASPYAACSTILDGSNNNTFQFNSANNFRMKGLDFVSFPNAQGEFVLVAGTSNGSSETWNGIIEENSFWGKQYAAYGTHIIENIQFKGNSIGCASVGGIVFVLDISAGQNKNVFEDNYVDFQGACQALPTVGLQMTVAAGGGTITNASILRNEVQNSTASNATAIDCGGCVGFNITGNDIESSVGSSGWQYAITVEAENGVGSGAGTIGTNTLYTAFSMPSALLLNVNNSFVAPQSIIAAGTITNGVTLSGGGNNTVAPPSAISGNITNLIAQTNGTAGNFITSGYLSMDSGGDVLLSSPANIALNASAGIDIEGTTYVSMSGTGLTQNSNPIYFEYGNSASPSFFQMFVDSTDELHLGGSGDTVLLPGTLATSKAIDGIGGYMVNWNMVIPVTATGYHGSGAGDVKVQFSDGTGTSGYAAVYDANGGLTNGGGAPANLSGATFTGAVSAPSFKSNVLPAGFNLVSTFGDSLTAGNQGSSVSYPAQLAAITGKPVSNYGIGGQTSTQIAVRMNAYAGTANQKFASAFTIPTSGSVTVTFPAGYEPSYNANSNYQPPPAGVLISTTVGGTTYQGIVTDNGSHVYSFTPLVYPGSAVSVPNGNAWLAVIGNAFQGCAGIEMGRNNFASQSQVLADVAASVAAVTAVTPCYYVLGIPNEDVANEWTGATGYNQIVALNAALASAYGSHFINLITAAAALYNPSNPIDVLDHNNGVGFAYSLRAGDVSGTVGTVSSTSTCAFTTSVALYSGNVLTIGSEYIYISGGTSGAYTCTRGYAGSTAATYTSGTAFTGVDPLHPGQNGTSAANTNFGNGYAAIARWVANLLPSLAGENTLVPLESMNAASVAGTTIGPVSASGNSYSNPLTFTGLNNGVANTATEYTDPYGDLFLQAAPGETIQINNGYLQINPTCSSGNCNSYAMNFVSLASGSGVYGQMFLDTYGNLHIGLPSSQFSDVVTNANFYAGNAYVNANGTLLPGTLTGFHGTGAGDVKVQFSDGTGTSVAAAFDATGGLTAAPAGIATLSSGTTTVSSSSACTPSATCVYKLTNCGLNTSTAIGTLSIGTVAAGSSFVINSESSTATVVTGDKSVACWQIN